VKRRRTSLCAAATALALCLALSPAIAQDEDESDPVETPDIARGGAVIDFYDLVAAAPEDHFACESILEALNKPKLVDDLWDVLVGTPYNYIWQRSDDGETWSYPTTLWDITPRLDTLDRLTVDLDGDGTPETIYRTPTMLHGQMYTEITVEPASASGNAPADQVIEIEIKDVKARPPLNITPRDIGGDFYYIDILAVHGRNYVIAADSVIGYSDEPRRPSVLVFTVDGEMQLNPVCRFRANKRI
jgi:hypothetical protein